MAREHGVVKWFSVEKGYGFIRRERGEDVFVHHSEIEGEGFRTLKQGERVEFEAKPGERGPRAYAVRRGDEAEPAAVAGAVRSPERAAGRGRRERDATPSAPRGAPAPSPNGDGATVGGGLRSLAAQIRERLGRRFGGLGG